LLDASDRAIPERLDHEDTTLADAIDRPHPLMPTPGNRSGIEAVPALCKRTGRNR